MVLNGDAVSMENIFRNINKDLSEEDILMLSPLHLAYIGDGVYELFIRTYLLDGRINVNQMNKRARCLVNARAQALIVSMLEEYLTDRENKIVKRGRNTKVHSSPKNMDIMDYKYATGFEALLGHLYLRKDYERLYEIMDMILFRPTEMKLQGGIFDLEGRDRASLEAELRKLLDGENIAYENFSLDFIEGDEIDSEKELELKIDFPMDILDFEKKEKKIGDKIIGHIEAEGMSFGGGWSLEFKEDVNEG